MNTIHPAHLIRGVAAVLARLTASLLALSTGTQGPLRPERRSHHPEMGVLYQMPIANPSSSHDTESAFCLTSYRPGADRCSRPVTLRAGPTVRGRSPWPRGGRGRWCILSRPPRKRAHRTDRRFVTCGNAAVLRIEVRMETVPVSIRNVLQ